MNEGRPVSVNPVLVIGVGNRDRGDDGVGPAVVDEIRRRAVPVGTMVREGDLADLLLDWGPDDDVTIVDCVAGTGPVGAVSVLDAGELRGSGLTSTHGMGVAESVQLATVMDRLPRRLRVVGVSGRTFRYGPISAELSRLVPAIADEVLDLATFGWDEGCVEPQSVVGTGAPSSSAEV
jgi:hydrogenase maturation protease